MGLKNLTMTLGLSLVTSLCFAQGPPPPKVHLIPSDDSRFNALLLRDFAEVSQSSALKTLGGKAEIVLSESPYSIKLITVKYVLRYADGHQIQTFRTITPNFIGTQRLPGNSILLQKDRSVLVSPYASLERSATKEDVSAFMVDTMRGFALQGQIDNPIVKASIDTVVFDGGYVSGQDESGSARQFCDQHNSMILEAMNLLALGYDPAVWKARLDDDAEIKTASKVDSHSLAMAQAAVEFRQSLAKLGPDGFEKRMKDLASSRRMELKVRTAHKGTNRVGE